MFPRRATRKVMVGNVALGGEAPVALQTMTMSYTYKIDKCVAEINKLASAGADLVRVAVPEKRDTEALRQILPQVAVPLVADVHFHFERALEAVEAGVQKIRLNPGNLQDRPRVVKVIHACRERGIPIRVGANEGSIVERKNTAEREAEKQQLEADYRGTMARLMADKVAEYLEIFYAENFYDLVISAKSADPLICLKAYQEISRRCDHPLHLGVTHAGPPETGRIRSIASLAGLLTQGIGDTIRISYSADPVYEVQDGKELLCSLGLRPRLEPELIACPTCGRIEVDLIRLVKHVQDRILPVIDLPLKIAVMGCVVNGPGEAEGSDVAVFAGKERGVIYVQGVQVETVNEADMLDRLLFHCQALSEKVKRGEATLFNRPVEIKPA